ncbi:MAG TPA: hypothetical protein PLT27_13330, partial [Nitrospira sp.]|nr:hypothetical protein [Nitrospira sp.]
LPADELREHPIRPGLSTVTSINITESGQSVWTSLATPSTAEYETDVYADELPTAESLAKEVIATNLRRDRLEGKSGFELDEGRQ